MKIPHLNLHDFEIEEDIVKIIPVELALFHDILAIDKVGKCLTVAIGYEEYYDTLELTKLQRELRDRLKLNVQFVSTEAETIEEYIHKFYSAEKSQVS